MPKMPKYGLEIIKLNKQIQVQFEIFWSGQNERDPQHQKMSSLTNIIKTNL